MAISIALYSRGTNTKEAIELSDLIFGKGLKDDFEAEIEMCCSEDVNDRFSELKGELSIRRIENGVEIVFPSINGPVLKRIENIPDITRKKGSEKFISVAKEFSRRYDVPMELKNNGGSISAWFYFSTEILKGPRKKAFSRLLGLADEVSMIPRPKSQEAWCDCAVILTYRTHYTTVNGELMNPE